MNTLYQILAILGACLIIWLLYTRIKSSPQIFSKENFSKSFFTMGLLGLGLILFIMLCVMLLRTG